jgi:hypothetical protein
MKAARSEVQVPKEVERLYAAPIEIVGTVGIRVDYREKEDLSSCDAV